MRSMRVFPFIFLLVTALTVSAQEAEPESSSELGSEPLDRHTEVRLSRYVKSRKCPVTHHEEVRIRCEYLLREADKETDRRRNTRLREREENRGFDWEKEDAGPSYIEVVTFDPYGPGSEPLEDTNRERRLKRYVENNNCQVTKLRDPDLTRCLWLLSKRHDERKLIEDRRTTRLQARRSVTKQEQRRQATITTQREQVRIGLPPDFDMSGLGSTPLTEAEENRLMRYVNEDKCPQTFNRALLERCHFLLKLRRYQRYGQLQTTRGRIRVVGGSGAAQKSRGVDTQYRQSIIDVTSSVSVQKSKGGLVGRPRTLQELRERYGVNLIRQRSRTQVEGGPVYGESYERLRAVEGEEEGGE